MYARCSIAYCCLSASVSRSVRPDRLGKLPQGFPPLLQNFSVRLLDLLELFVPVRSPFDVDVDDFVDIGFLDRVDDARELLRDRRRSRRFPSPPSPIELDFQILLEPAIGSTCSRIMRYLLTSLSWSAAFSANWLLTRVNWVSDIARNLATSLRSRRSGTGPSAAGRPLAAGPGP